MNSFIPSFRRDIPNIKSEGAVNALVFEVRIVGLLSLAVFNRLSLEHDLCSRAHQTIC
jgi:hypothetical protein